MVGAMSWFTVPGREGAGRMGRDPTIWSITWCPQDCALARSWEICQMSVNFDMTLFSTYFPIHFKHVFLKSSETWFLYIKTWNVDMLPIIQSVATQKSSICYFSMRDIEAIFIWIWLTGNFTWLQIPSNINFLEWETHSLLELERFPKSSI